MSELIARIKRSRSLSGLFEINFLNAFHYILVVYINSSFLKTFLPSSSVSALFTISAIGSILMFIYAPHLIRKFGNKNFFLTIVTAEILALISLWQSTSTISLIVSFFVHYVAVYMIFYSLDVFFEAVVKNEKETGSLRGIYLTIANTAIMLGPSLVSILVEGDDYRKVYAVSALFLLPMIVLGFTRLNRFNTKTINHVDISSTIDDLKKDKDIMRVVSVNFLLQFFFAWMVVYTPIYLHEIIGFEWSSLGVMFSIMLLPFIIFEIPAGKLADTKYGEKEILSLGFIVAILSTLSITLLKAPEIVPWTIALFMTRVGASFIEIGSDSYFFKHVTSTNANIISAYRGVIPVAYIIAPAIFFLSESILGFAYSYIVLALILSFGFLSILPLKDTR